MKTKKLLFYLLAAILGGCLPIASINPLYTEKDLTFEDKLSGTWVNDHNDPNEKDEFWQFKPVEGPPKAYELVLYENNKTMGIFDAYLLKIKGQTFLDVIPNQFPDKNTDSDEMELPFNAFFFIPVHTFLKINQIGPELKMQIIDEDDVEKMLKSDPNIIEYEKAEDRIVLTAGTKDLQDFITKHQDKLFGETVIFVKSKPNDPNKN